MSSPPLLPLRPSVHCPPPSTRSVPPPNGIENGGAVMSISHPGASIFYPDMFAEIFLQTDLWENQKEILRAIATKPLVAVKACHSSGKCVASSEILTLGDGSRVKACDLIGKTFTLPTLDENGDVIVVTARAEFNATEEVFAITTDTGQHLVRNANHPLWMGEQLPWSLGLTPSEAGKCNFGRSPAKQRFNLPDNVNWPDVRGTIFSRGWKQVSKLRAGDYIAATDILPVFGFEEMRDEEVKVLAYLIGDKCLVGSGSVEFTQQSNKQLAEFCSCVEVLGGKTISDGDINYRVVSSSTVRKKSKNGGAHRINPILNLVRMHGLNCKKSKDKFIPDKIFRLSKRQIAIFLSRLFSTDGYAAESGINYVSVSAKLIDDIRILLLRFGIVPQVRFLGTEWTYKGELRHGVCWDLNISVVEDIEKFCNEIGIYGKEDQIRRALTTVQIAKDNRAGPRFRKTGTSNNALTNFGRGRNKRVERRKGAPKGTYWSKIKSIEPAGITSTVAIEVPEYHTFLTSHYEHNSFVAARAALWFLARYEESTVICTAPTWGQIEKVLWTEIHAALVKSKYPFPKALKTELSFASEGYPQRIAYGLSTSVTNQDEGVKFQGIHNRHVLIIMDEAPGVDPKIWQAMEGARASGDVHVLAIGNPTISSGPFHDAFIKGRGIWEPYTISAFDTPNFNDIPGFRGKQLDKDNNVLEGSKLECLLKMTDADLNNNPIPYLTTRLWVKEMFYKYGPGHPYWESRVEGNFPKQSEDALISLSWLEEANTDRRLQEKPGAGKVNAGLDVAGGGSAETSLTIRRGPKILVHKQWPIEDPRGEIVALLAPFREELEAVNVDAVGIGHYICKHLEDLKFPAVPIIAQAPSSDSEQFKDIKAEFYWGLRLRLQQGDFSGLSDEITIGQLAGIRYKHNSRGQIEIESKEQAIKRGVPSPDRAESIMLAFGNQKLCYGVLELNKQEMAAVAHKEQISAAKPQLKAGACPKCSATCVVLRQGSWHCNNCSNDWQLEKSNPLITKSFSRTETLRLMDNEKNSF